MKAIFGRVAKSCTVGALFFLINCLSQPGFGQGVMGPDTKGISVANVGSDAILKATIDGSQAACLGDIVDELVKTVSNDSIRVESVTKVSNLGNYRWNHQPGTNEGFEVRLRTTLDCVFYISQFDTILITSKGERAYGSDFEIKGDLNNCPGAFPNNFNRTPSMYFKGKFAKDASHRQASYGYREKDVFKLDSLGGIRAKETYALNPKVVGPSMDPLEFIASGTDVIVFSYPAEKYRQCLQRGLSDLAKK